MAEANPLIPSVPPPRLLLKSHDAAKSIEVSVRKLADLTRRGLVPAVKIDGSTRYAIADLEAFVKGLPRVGGPS